MSTPVFRASLKRLNNTEFKRTFKRSRTQPTSDIINEKSSKPRTYKKYRSSRHDNVGPKSTSPTKYFKKRKALDSSNRNLHGHQGSLLNSGQQSVQDPTQSSETPTKEFELESQTPEQIELPTEQQPSDLGLDQSRIEAAPVPSQQLNEAPADKSQDTATEVPESSSNDVSKASLSLGVQPEPEATSKPRSSEQSIPDIGSTLHAIRPHARYVLHTPIYSAQDPDTVTYEYTSDFPTLVNLSSKRSPLGLHNVGGTSCYRTAALTLLMHIPAFLNWLNHHESVCKTSVSCLACLLFDLADQIWNGRSNQAFTSKWYRHFDILARKCRPRPAFLDGAQHDSAEYLRWILSELRDRYDAPKGIIAALFLPNIVPTWTCSACGTSDKNAANQELVLPVGVSQPRNATLQQYLQKALHDTIDDYKCSHCQSTRQKKREHRFETWPETLVIQLQIFDVFSNPLRPKKIQSSVRIPETLDLGVNGPVPFNGTTGPRYHLRAVVKHIGSMAGGHYIAFARGPNGISKIDDSCVSRSDVRGMTGNKHSPGFTPYLLAYGYSEK